MQKENTMTVGQWCGQWFIDNRPKWNGNTEGGYSDIILNALRIKKPHGNTPTRLPWRRKGLP